ncbi:MAG: hypothetical protein OEY86_00885 [Nitrospira sp.]|nr:hypothetical protein [Nitrospira sp.]
MLLIAWLLSVFLLFPLQAQAAFTCVDAGTVEVHESSPANPRTISYTTPAGNNRITFAGVGFRNGVGVTISSVTQGGNAMTADTTFQYVSTILGGNLYRLRNPPSGTNDVVVTWSGAVSQADIIIWTCLDSDLTEFRSTNQASGVSTTPSVTAGTVAAGDIVVDFFSSDDAGAPSVGANQTVIHEGTTASTNGGASYQAGADGGVMSWTIASDDWVIFTYVVKPAASDEGGQPLWFQ